MPYQDFKNPATAQSWDAGNQGRNPSRSEQLDMLLSIIADHYQPGKTMLDLGIGTGLVEEMLFKRIPQAQLVGVDASSAMLELAHNRLQPYASQYTTLIHDLSAIDSLRLPSHPYQVIFSVQTLHHLTDTQMKAAYHFIYNTLESGGLFILLDRIAVKQGNLFSVYQSLWARQDALYQTNVHSWEGETFADHQRIVAERGDLPMSLERHLQLLKQAGFETACLHLQTNRALLVGKKS
ncbi:MAG: methyltransferase domain-containing protein [Anaerolineaceae bacterium]|nr:methyltransferase domain-containing protein [Anaerolineaceae bacterium]